LLAAVLLAGCASAAGCASDPPKPVPQQEIRGHADQFNEKMKQEEMQHGSSPHGGMMH
jgi:hypothetical protein